MKKTVLTFFFAIFALLCVCGVIVHEYVRSPKIAVLYIATGRYFVFWPDFYKSMEKKFLPKYEKHYFVFTDNEFKNKPENVTEIYRKWHGFPLDTLDRYEMFIEIEKDLQRYDYIYFLNANAEVVDYVNEEIFPSKEQGIMVAIHPNHYRNQNRKDYPYEDNPKSTAYIAPNEGKWYVQGAFIGGRKKDFLKMAHVLAENIKTDKKNNLMAIWHDESHLNRYIINKNPLVMEPNYVWQYCDSILTKQYKDKLKIVMRRKKSRQWGGIEYFRPIEQLSLKGQEERGLYTLYHGDWLDQIYQLDANKSKFCRKREDICGIVRRNHNSLLIEWENNTSEKYVVDEINELFVLSNL